MRRAGLAGRGRTVLVGGALRKQARVAGEHSHKRSHPKAADGRTQWERGSAEGCGPRRTARTTRALAHGLQWGGHVREAWGSPRPGQLGSKQAEAQVPS